MNLYLKYLLPVIVLFFLAVAISLGLGLYVRKGLDFYPVIFLIAAFTFSTSLSTIIFVRGLSRKAGEQAMHTFSALGVKFLSEIFIALFWFLSSKKTSPGYILLFFLLYLSFSSILIYGAIKTLKKKPL